MESVLVKIIVVINIVHVQIIEIIIYAIVISILNQSNIYSRTN